MYLIVIKRVCFAIFCFISGINVMAQPRITAFTDLGQNNVSDGLFIKATGLAAYQFSKYRIETGFQLDIKSNNENVFTGINVNALREFSLGKFSFEMDGFFVWTPYSGILRETNLGLMLNHNRRHFAFTIGTNFRTYAFTNKAIDNYELNGNTKIHENWNLMYLIGYYIKPIDNPWNIGLNITNIDHFLINQETNPEFNLRAIYTVKPPIRLFVESWYKSAGSLNLYVNHFGFFFRSGIIWNINIEK